jgi:hypothetical protein
MSYCKLLCAQLAAHGSADVAAQAIGTFRSVVDGAVSYGPHATAGIHIGNMIPNVKVSGKALGKRAKSSVEGGGSKRRKHTAP